MSLIRPYSLYVILDKKWVGSRSITSITKDLLRGGADMIQYRNKSGSPEECLRDALSIRKQIKNPNLFIVNDDLQLAIQSKADGVHLGQRDLSVAEARKILGPTRIIGVSIHNVSEALKAEKDGADYISVGDLFGSQTKDETVRTSLTTLRDICTAVSIPVIGIGGITLENAQEVFAAGAQAIAVSRSILTASNLQLQTRLFKSIQK